MDRPLNSAQGGFFGDLTPTLQRALMAVASTRTYADGTAIHRRGDADRALSVIRTGAVRLSNVGRDGREVVLATLRPGESYGEFTLFADLPRQYDLTARGETVVDVVERKAFDALLDSSPALSRHVIRHLAGRLHQALELLDDERRLPLAARLAKMLLRWPTRSGDRAVIVATQQELADELAVSRVALSGALGLLVAEHLVETGYGRIRLSDPERLEQWVSTHVQLSPAGRKANWDIPDLAR